MKDYLTFEEIGLDRVDDSDKRFVFAFPGDVDDLLPSVKEAGILFPPVLQKRGAAPYRIVCGHRRVSAARRAGIQMIAARVAGEDADDLALFLEAIRENTATRSVNDVERGRCLHRLVSEFGTDRGARNEVMKQLGLSPGDRLFEQYVSLVRLTDHLQHYIVKHNIPIRVSARISAWTEKDQKALQELLQRVTFGGNALRKLVELLEEIALREKSTITGILEDPEIKALRKNQELTPTQIRDRIEARLRMIRYPHLSEKLESVNELMRKVQPKGIRLVPPPFLEGETLEVSFQFGSVEELSERIASLKDLMGENEIREIFGLLKP